MVPSRGTDPWVKFLDDANATPSSSFEHTPTPVLCRLYVLLPSATLPAIEHSMLIEAALLPLAFLSKFRLHFHQIQPTHFLYRELHRECVEFYHHCPPRQMHTVHPYIAPFSNYRDTTICVYTLLTRKWCNVGMMYCSVSLYTNDVTAHPHMVLFLFFLYGNPTPFSFFKMFSHLQGYYL